MNETVQMLFGLFGGLAIFLYGMNLMSDSLQKVAGERMRTILGLLTKNPVMGVISGALVTAVLQSSSATSVMAIGFVSAGLMTLPQAISIIFGANIGTTMTAQLIAFKLSDYIYLIIIVGFLLYFFAKKERIKSIGATIFGFGLLFDGIEIMGSVMKPLATSPVFSNMIQQVADVPILGLLTGLVMTLVVQSSSATIAVLQNIASTAGPDGVSSIISLAGALPVLFGDNIGTTITAVLASIGQSINAKRTAAAHCIFNLSGSLIFIWFVQPYAHFIQWISPKGPEIEVISRQIANAHTCFNVVMTLIWTPLIYLMVKIVCRIVKDKGAAATRSIAEPRFLDQKMIGRPVAALEMVSNETARITDLVRGVLYKMSDASKDTVVEISGKLIEDCSEIRALCLRTQDFLSAVMASGKLSEAQADRTTDMMFIVDNLDRITEHLKDINENVNTIQQSDIKYSNTAAEDLNKYTLKLIDMYETSIIGLVGDVDVDRKKLELTRSELFELRAKMFRAHTKRVQKGKCDASLQRRLVPCCRIWRASPPVVWILPTRLKSSIPSRSICPATATNRFRCLRDRERPSSRTDVQRGVWAGFFYADLTEFSRNLAFVCVCFRYNSHKIFVKNRCGYPDYPLAKP